MAKSPGSAQVTVGPRLQVWIANRRSAVNRPWPGPSIALTLTERIVCAPPARSTVTDGLATSTFAGSPVTSHWVASVSSIRFAWSVPSPVAVAPRRSEAQFWSRWTVSVTVSPALTSIWNRRIP